MIDVFFKNSGRNLRTLGNDLWKLKQKSAVILDASRIYYLSLENKLVSMGLMAGVIWNRKLDPKDFISLESQGKELFYTSQKQISVISKTNGKILHQYIFPKNQILRQLIFLKKVPALVGLVQICSGFELQIFLGLPVFKLLTRISVSKVVSTPDFNFDPFQELNRIQLLQTFQDTYFFFQTFDFEMNEFVLQMNKIEVSDEESFIIPIWSENIPSALKFNETQRNFSQSNKLWGTLEDFILVEFGFELVCFGKYYALYYSSVYSCPILIDLKTGYQTKEKFPFPVTKSQIALVENSDGTCVGVLAVRDNETLELFIPDSNNPSQFMSKWESVLPLSNFRALHSMDILEKISSIQSIHSSATLFGSICYVFLRFPQKSGLVALSWLMGEIHWVAQCALQTDFESFVAFGKGKEILTMSDEFVNIQFYRTNVIVLISLNAKSFIHIFDRFTGEELLFQG